MNIIRIKIIGFWLLFVVFWLLMYFCWRYRFLWAALFPAAVVMLELIKPRRPSPVPPGIKMPPGMRMPPTIKICLWLAVIAFVLTVVVHGFLFPGSAVLYLIAKIALAAPCVPVLFYKIWLDYTALRLAQNASAEPGAPPNAGSAGAPPASVS